MASTSASMRSYAIRRILEALPLILGVIVVTFTVVHLAPGDPALILMGADQSDPQYLQMMRERLGLDRPFYEQLARYVLAVFRGDLGHSFARGQPVLHIILNRVPATLLLMGAALLFSSITGIVSGVYSSKRPYTLRDNLSTSFSLLGYSLPVFWLAQILVMIFAVRLGWFPVQGMVSVREELSGMDAVVDIAWHLVLPVLSLGMWNLALVSRMTRASMLETLKQDFIVTAWAKGLDERTVLYRHALRNALLPVVTVIGLSLGTIVTGAVLTETIFGWPGMGRLMYDAISARDYPILLGIFIIVSISVIVVNLLTDLVYAFLDPRIRYR
jgi:ABC-type dipeptide/oligopeptide/nickel transport system permease component